MVKRKTFSKSVRNAVWVNNCGEVFSNKCYLHFCVRKITVHDFECGHIISHANGGSDHMSNLLPICTTCNRSMGTKSIYEYNESVQLKGKTPQPIKEGIKKYWKQGKEDSDEEDYIELCEYDGRKGCCRIC